MTLRQRGYLVEAQRVSRDFVIKKLQAFANIPKRWSSYLSPDNAQTKFAAIKALRLFVGIDEDPDRGDSIVAYRATNRREEYQDLKMGKQIVSRDHSSGRQEKGLSVATGLHYAARGYKYVYRVKGRVAGFGSDGEPLLLDVKVVGKIKTSNSMISWDLKRGPTARKFKIYNSLAKETGLSKFDLIRLLTKG